MKVSQIKNFKMNDITYKKRRKVIDLIYEAKKEIKDLPRIEVRIGEARKKNVLGVAMLKDCKIWITDDAINMGDDALRNVVFHEIVHAVTGFRHDKNCYLMHPNLPTNPKPEKSLEAFIKYFN